MISKYMLMTGRDGYARFVTMVLTTLAIGLVVFGFYFVGYGFDVNDEAYQTMNAMNPRINPQAILASTISNLFGRVFGFSLYPMRVLTFFLTILSVGMSSAYYYRVRRNMNQSLLLFILILAAALCTPTKSRLIGWDCYAVFFTTLSLLSIMEIWRGGGKGTVVCLGLFVACATLSRFPDIVLVPVAILAFFGCDKGSKYGLAKNSVLFLLAYLAFMTLLLSFIYEWNPMRWIVSLNENLVSGHDVGRLVRAYIHSGRLDVLDIMLLSLFLFVVCHYISKERMRKVAFCGLFVLLVAVLCLKMDRVYYPVCRLLTSCIVIMSAIYAASAYQECRLKSIIRALVILGCCVVPMAGSDGGTFKFMNLTSIPVCLLMLSDVPSRKYAIQLSKSMVWCVLLSIGTVMPFFTAWHTTFDGGWYNARYEVDHSFLRQNTTTELRAAEINEMIDEGRCVIPDSSFILGHNNRRFFSEYLWGSRNKLWPHSWDDRIFEDQEKIDLLLEAVEDGDIHDIVFVKYGANDTCDFDKNPMRNALEATNLYSTEDYRWFVVLRRK